MIVGITGTLGAGKGTIVDFLKNRGFEHYSVRQYLTEEIEKRGMKVNRDNMVMVANELREQHGPSYIVEQLYQKAERTGGDAVIESIRAVGEVKALSEKEDFYLFSVDADSRLRYERIKMRKSSTDMVDYETFLENEKREMENKDPYKQNIKKCMEMADFRFENNGTKEDLEKQVEKVFSECLE